MIRSHVGQPSGCPRTTLWSVAPCLFPILLAPLLHAGDDAVLKAMKDELQRSMTLQFNSLDKPYYLEYLIEDGHRLQITAVLDGIAAVDENDFRIPRVRLRIGSPQFDNTNYAGGRGSYSGRAGATFPLDDDYATLRHAFWLTTDQAYKTALETISRKRAALKNMSIIESLPDFSPAPPAKMVLNFTPVKIDPQPWVARVEAALAAAFLKFPLLHGSGVEYDVSDGTRRFVTSEGCELRLREQESEIRLQASAQAKDGMTMRDAVVFNCLGLDGLPSQAVLMRVVQDLGSTVTAMAAAPRADDYSGPVLFDGPAASQILAELLGHNLAMSRKPVSDQGGGGGGGSASELEGRIGSRILPESVLAGCRRPHPDQLERDSRLFGTMLVDEDGVESKPLTIIDKGVLKNVLLTRQPVRGFPTTNARARLQGSYGDSVAGVTNLIVQSNETVARAQLKSKTRSIC